MAYLPFSKHVVLCALVYLVFYTKYLLGLSAQPVFPQVQREVTVTFNCYFFPRWYVTYGHELIWKNREPLVKAWHEMRTKNTGKGGGGRSN